jgi:hypothetical protein
MLLASIITGLMALGGLVTVQLQKKYGLQIQQLKIYIYTYNSVGAFEINCGRLEVVGANALVCCFVQCLTGCIVTTRPGAVISIAFAVRVASPISNPL